MRSLLVVAALAAARAQQAFWPQTGGGRFRAGVWPPSKLSGNVGDEGEVRARARGRARSDYSARPPTRTFMLRPASFRASCRKWTRRRRRL